MLTCFIIHILTLYPVRQALFQVFLQNVNSLSLLQTGFKCWSYLTIVGYAWQQCFSSCCSYSIPLLTTDEYQQRRKRMARQASRRCLAVLYAGNVAISR